MGYPERPRWKGENQPRLEGGEGLVRLMLGHKKREVLGWGEDRSCGALEAAIELQLVLWEKR